MNAVAQQAEPGLSTSMSGSTETDSTPRISGGRTSGRAYGRSLQKNCKAEDLHHCGQCGYVTQYKNNLGKHLRSMHQGKTSDAGRRTADTPGGSGASGGPLPGGGTVAGAEVGAGDNASGDASDDEIISSDERGGGPEDGQEVEVKEMRSPFKKGLSQRRDRRNK